MSDLFLFDSETGRVETQIIEKEGKYICGYTQKEIVQTETRKVLPWDEAYTLLQEANRKRFCKGPVEITAEQFDDALNVLPPAKWQGSRLRQSFYVIEAITDDIHGWYAQLGDRYFTINESKYKTNDEIIALCAAAL
jgi:hypothetical protein